MAFTVDEPVSWIGYGLDDQANVTIAGNTTLTVGDGTHWVRIYANDTAGNAGSSSMVYSTAKTGVIDIAVISLLSSKQVVGDGNQVMVNITAENRGEYTETFNLTLYANTTMLTEITDISLASQGSKTISFMWNTTGFEKGKYTLGAYASPVQGETETANNMLVGSTITVTILGDVDGDLAVTILDVVRITGIYASKRGGPNFNPNSDLNDDGQITILDVVICTGHYGQKWP